MMSMKIIIIDSLKQYFPELDNVSVYAAEVDRNDDIWFAVHYGGLLKYSHGEFQVFKVYEGDFQIRGFSIDGNNDIWFTAGNRIYRFNEEEIKKYLFAENLEDEKCSLYSMCSDSRGNIWYSFYAPGSSDKLHRMKDGKYENDFYTISEVDRFCSEIFCDSKDRVWFFANDIFCLEGNELKKLTDNVPYMHKEIKFSEDKGGVLWIAMSNRILKYEDGRLSELEAPYSKLPMEEYSDIVFGKNGSAFMLCSNENSTKYLTELKNDEFQIHTPPKGSGLETLAADSQGMIWTGKQSTVGVFDNGEYRSWETSIDMSGQSDGISGMKFDSANNLWITANYWHISSWGGYDTSLHTGNGIYLFKDNTVWQYEEPEAERIELFEFAPDSTVWMYMYKRKHVLGELQGGVLKTYDTSNSGMPANYIEDLATDKNNNVWLSFFRASAWGNSNSPIKQYFSGYGLTKFDGDSWQTYNTENSRIPSNVVIEIRTGIEGKVWTVCQIDTGKYIISVFYDDKWTNFDKPEDTIYTQNYYYFGNMFIRESIPMETDSKGNLWVCARGKNALYKCGENAIEIIKKGEFPIQDSEIIKLQIDKNDNLWISTNKGLVIYNENGLGLTGIDEEFTEHENDLWFHCFPNPFSQFQTTTYELREAGHVTLKVYDFMGNEVAVLANGFKPAGRHEARFEAAGLPEGMYFLQLRAGNEVVSENVVHIK